MAGIDHLLVDMDGVLYRGQTPLPGSAEFLPWLRQRGIGLQLLTNNSTLTPAQNAAKLDAMGIHSDRDEILTSAEAAALFLKKEGASGASVLVVGEEGLRTALEGVGVRVVDDPQHVDWVVAGLDRRATYDSLKDAALAIESGARFLATNSDSSLPVEDGEVPGAGALQAAIIATTGVKPTVVGKPETFMLELAMERIGGTNSGTAILGDRLDTDILAASRAGMKSILVLTGITSRAELENSELQPTDVVEDLPELMARWVEL